MLFLFKNKTSEEMTLALQVGMEIEISRNRLQQSDATKISLFSKSSKRPVWQTFIKFQPP